MPTHLSRQLETLDEAVRKLVDWQAYAVVPKKKVKEKPDLASFKVGDKVRLEESKSTGTIDAIEKEIATVNYGMFTTKVHLSKLEKH